MVLIIIEILYISIKQSEIRFDMNHERVRVELNSALQLQECKICLKLKISMEMCRKKQNYRKNFKSKFYYFFHHMLKANQQSMSAPKVCNQVLYTIKIMFAQHSNANLENNESSLT